METFNGLPLVSATLDEKKYMAGVNFWSFVEKPAVETSLFKFSAHTNTVELIEETFKFAHKDSERRIVTTIGMVANKAIYRKMKFGAEEREFYIKFPADVVERMAFKFMKDQHTKNVNIEHDENQVVDSNGAYIVETYLYDQSRGMKVPDYLEEEATPGSWVLSWKVEDDDLWGKIEKEEVTGVSLEGDFGLELNFSKNFVEFDKSIILDPNIDLTTRFNAIKKAVNDSK